MALLPVALSAVFGIMYCHGQNLIAHALRWLSHLLVRQVIRQGRTVATVLLVILPDDPGEEGADGVLSIGSFFIDTTCASLSFDTTSFECFPRLASSLLALPPKERVHAIQVEHFLILEEESFLLIHFLVLHQLLLTLILEGWVVQHPELRLGVLNQGLGRIHELVA